LIGFALTESIALLKKKATTYKKGISYLRELPFFFSDGGSDDFFAAFIVLFFGLLLAGFILYPHIGDTYDTNLEKTSYIFE
jgi:hypothetical protein